MTTETPSRPSRLHATRSEEVPLSSPPYLQTRLARQARQARQSLDSGLRTRPNCKGSDS